MTQMWQIDLARFDARALPESMEALKDRHEKVMEVSHIHPKKKTMERVEESEASKELTWPIAEVSSQNFGKRSLQESK
eukprot:CAMPEP_0174890526 /NCGR_PEP_ID=MMETSP0167-20121228/5678_1 /TAXON_ID=38298 /ORGANISM="Rhodella maculata, Strain CCMP736" /LENGTH=77 /DNA_ID=CAMNT_0016128365 /DNA_START=844 /DNA_END=1074 /DNA_ORIENTATION=+